jgi:hypothetical protein
MLSFKVNKGQHAIPDKLTVARQGGETFRILLGALVAFAKFVIEVGIILLDTVGTDSKGKVLFCVIIIGTSSAPTTAATTNL